MLNIFQDGLPMNKLHAYCPLSSIPYLPDIDNKKIGLYIQSASEIPNFMKMLASPRADGQQRVIYMPRELNLIWLLLQDIKKVKIS
jgi:hypothetical protein